jgi:hypothetical protein
VEGQNIIIEALGSRRADRTFPGWVKDLELDLSIEQAERFVLG